MSRRATKGPPPLRREIHRWRDRRFGYLVAVDTSGRVYSHDEGDGWCEDFETYGAEALRRVSRALAKATRSTKP